MPKKTVSVFFKNKIRLDPSRMNFEQREMAVIGLLGLKEIKRRVGAGRGPKDGPAKPLKSPTWKRIKAIKAPPAVRNLRGTGLMRQQGGKKKGRLKFVGHLLDQLRLKVTRNRAILEEPTTRAGRLKARANERRERWFVFSPANERVVVRHAIQILFAKKGKLIRSSGGALPLPLPR